MSTLQFSHDPDAGTIYTYFTELNEGQALYELEYPASLLLDEVGQLFGFRLALDDEVTLGQLELVLELPHCRLDMGSGQLWVQIAAEHPAEIVALEQSALLDLDGEERLLGVELVVPKELRTPARLARLAPLVVALDDEPELGEGPVVLSQLVRAAEAVEPLASAEAPISAGAPMRVGFIALVGKPNVGKSTLMNRLLGQKVAIVSPRPQTTRVPVRGILNRADAQVIFIDTPGIHQPRHKLGQLMVELARRALPNADLVCFMVDISRPPSKLDGQIAAQLRGLRRPKLLVLNKIDVKTPDGPANLAAYRALGDWDTEVAICARSGAGFSTLLDEFVARLPEGHPLYPTDQITDQSEQQMVAELVREKVLLFTAQEVPHSVAVEVEEWEDKEQATYIRLTINVEKESQKGILIGAGGAMLKKIGTTARVDVEALLGRPVYLDLWVKVRSGWRDDQNALGWLGYRLKDHS